MIQTPVNIQSTTYAPAVNAYATTANAGYFRSGGMALEATTAAPGATALLATANASNGIAIQAQAYSDRGVTLSIEAHGGADLLHAQRDGDAAPRFRIANDANVYVNWTLVTEFGPTGDPGLDGRDGTNGANGAPGPRGFGATYALCTDASSCLNRCKGGWIAVQAVGPCVVGADFGTCGRLGEDGVCCVCGT